MLANVRSRVTRNKSIFMGGFPGNSVCLQYFATCLKERPQAWRDRIEGVAMDGFSAFKSAADEELPAAVPVMDPSHGVRFAEDSLDDCRRRGRKPPVGTAAVPATRPTRPAAPCIPGSGR